MWLSEEEGTRLFGREKALRFIETFGGQQLYIPVKPIAKHKIAECIGIVGMAALCRECGKEWVNVSRKKNATKKAVIIDLLAQGVSQRQSAIQADVSRRWVSMIAHDCKELIAKKSLELGHSGEPRADVYERQSACGVVYGESA